MCRLILSYKYVTTVFHRHFDSLLMTLKVKKKQKKGRIESMNLCYANSKSNFNYIEKVLVEFLPRLQQFIQEFTSNKNFVGKASF